MSSFSMTTLKDRNLINTSLVLSSGGMLLLKDHLTVDFNRVHNALVAEVLSEWDITSQASIVATSAALQTGISTGLEGPVLTEFVMAALIGASSPLPANVSQAMTNAVVEVTILSRLQTLEKTSFAPYFNLKDVETITAVRDNGIFWIGEAFEEVTEDINKTMGLSIAQGLGREEATTAIMETFSGSLKVGRDKAEIVASASATTGRTLSSATTFEMIQATFVEFVNPVDERTSHICEVTNGTIFEVRDVINMRDQYLAATNPDDVRSFWGWKTDSEFDALVPDPANPSPSVLANAGVICPPLHGKCRSWLSVADSIVERSAVALAKAAIDGNTNAPYYSVNLSPTVDLYDMAKTDFQNVELIALPIDIFGEISFDQKLKDKALVEMESSNPLIAIPVRKQGTGYKATDFQHLIEASSEFGFDEVPCVVFSS